MIVRVSTEGQYELPDEALSGCTSSTTPVRLRWKRATARDSMAVTRSCSS